MKNNYPQIDGQQFAVAASSYSKDQSHHSETRGAEQAYALKVVNGLRIGRDIKLYRTDHLRGRPKCR